MASSALSFDEQSNLVYSLTATSSMLAAVLVSLSFAPHLAPICQRSCNVRMVATAGALGETIGMDKHAIDIIGDEHLEQLSAEGRVVIDLFADYCGPCKLVEPALKTLAAAEGVRIVKARLNESPKLEALLRQSRVEVSYLPTLVLLEDGKPKRSMWGTHEIMEPSLLSAFARDEYGDEPPDAPPPRTPSAARAALHQATTSLADYIAQRNAVRDLIAPVSTTAKVDPTIEFEQYMTSGRWRATH